MGGDGTDGSAGAGEAANRSGAGARRILVYGVTGSGKTTLARAIGERTGIPWHSADDEIGWLPGWQERPTDQQRALAEEIAAGDAWVLDTAYGRWRDLVLPRADLIVALDYPRWVSLRRLLHRTGRRIVRGEAVCNGNRETLRLAVSTDSIIAWHFRTFARKRVQIDAWEADPTGPPVLRLQAPAETERWLATLAREGVVAVESSLRPSED